MITLTPSLSERKRILKKVCAKHPQWKLRFGIAVFLFIMAVLIIIGFAALLIAHHATAEAYEAFMAASICLAAVPFFCGLAVKNRAKYTCGLPFSGFANGSLTLKEEELEYCFWRVRRDEAAAYSSKHAVYPESGRFVYRIKKSDVTSIEIEDGVCTIRGKATTHMPKWAWEDDAVRSHCDTFRFILAFEQSDCEQIIRDWHR